MLFGQLQKLPLDPLFQCGLAPASDALYGDPVLDAGYGEDKEDEKDAGCRNLLP